MLLGLQHGMAALIVVNALHAVLLAEGLGLAGNQVRGGNDLDVLHPLVLGNVRAGNPAGADDADADLSAGIHFLFFLVDALEIVKNVFCHFRFFLSKM